MQTPLATLHKFNGWADLFLTTPNTGLQDLYLGAAYKFDGVKLLPGLNAAVTWHKFDSDVRRPRLRQRMGREPGLQARPLRHACQVRELRRQGFAVDTEKFWLQVEFAY